MESLDDFRQSEDLRATVRRLQAQLATAKFKVDELVAVTMEAAIDAVRAYGPMPPIAKPVKDRRRGGEVALWHLTDWQGGKKTVSYDSEVMVKRVEHFWDRAQRITELQRSDHPVNGCVIAFGGDMVEGLFNFPTQPFEIDSTIHTQWVNVSNLIVRTIRQALSIYDWVEVSSEWGNHGRIGSKRDAVPRSDNFDRMCYTLARELLKDETRLVWPDSTDDIQHIEIGAYRALNVHGDEVGRNGFASTGTFISHANRWKAGAHHWDFQDIYVGHYHKWGEEQLANGDGRVFWTGSTESGNRYASDNLAAGGLAQQRLHFIDPKAGRVTAQYRIYL